MWPDRVSNPGPLTYESGALPIALRGPATVRERLFHAVSCFLLRMLSAKNVFLPRISALLCFLSRLSTGSTVTQTDSAGSHLSCTAFPTGGKRLRTVSVETVSAGSKKLASFVLHPEFSFSFFSRGSGDSRFYSVPYYVGAPQVTASVPLH